MIDTESLRKKVYDLAIQGKLTKQNSSYEGADTLYTHVQEEKEKLIQEGQIRKEKNLPEIEAEEIPFEVPKGWRWARLGEICLQITDGTHKTPVYQSEGVPFLSVKNISSGSFDLSDLKYISETEHNELIKRCKPEKNDVLVCRIGTLGKAKTIDIDLEFSIFVSLGLIKTTEKTVSDYIALVINSGYGDTWIRDNKAGGAMHTYKINLNSLALLPIPLAPLYEIEEILEKISEVNSLISHIKELQELYYRDLSVLKSKIIDAGIRGKLTEQLPEDGDAETLYAQIQEEKAKFIKEGKIKKEKPLPEIDADEIPFEIPKNWKWVRLGDISSKIASGNTPAGGKRSEAYVEKGFCFFREQNIYNDGIREDGMVYISKELLDTRHNSTVLPKDILLNITGGSIGRCAIIPDDFSKGSINQHILIIRMVDERLRKYIHHCLCSPFMQKYIKGNAVGDKDGFSGGRCKNMLIPLPPLKEQERICDMTDAIIEKM